MKRQDVIDHFGSQSAACKALGLTRAMFNHWGYWISKTKALELSQITRGALKYDPKLYQNPKAETIDGRTVKPATHIRTDTALETALMRDNLFFLDNGKLIKANPNDYDAALFRFRNNPIYIEV